VKLFLDSSVILVACGRPQGASLAIFDLHHQAEWRLLASNYVIGEVRTNVPRLGPAAVQAWERFGASLIRVEDKLVFDWPVVFPASKDRPILFSAAAFADILLTLDWGDFGPLMGAGFYGLPIMKPGPFLERERSAGHLQPSPR
jgi:hypothetical protein